MKRRGDILRAAEVGLLATVGQTVVKVYQAPRISILSTGDELVPPSEVRQGSSLSHLPECMYASLCAMFSAAIYHTTRTYRLRTFCSTHFFGRVEEKVYLIYRIPNLDKLETVTG